MYIYNRYIFKAFLKSLFVCTIFFLFISFLGTYLEDAMTFARAFFLSAFELLYILDIVFLFTSIIFFVTTKNKFNYDIIRFYGKKQVQIFISVYCIIIFFSLLSVFVLKPIVINNINKTEVFVSNNVEYSITSNKDEQNKDFIYINDKDLLIVSIDNANISKVLLSNNFHHKDNKLILKNANILDFKSKSIEFLKTTEIDVKLKNKKKKMKYKIVTIYQDIKSIIEDFKNIYKKKEYIYSNINLIKEINLIILSIFNFNLILIILAKFSRIKNLLIDISIIIFIFFVSKNFIKFLQSIYIKYNHGLFMSTICALLMMIWSFYKIKKSESGV